MVEIKKRICQVLLSSFFIKEKIESRELSDSIRSPKKIGTPVLMDRCRCIGIYHVESKVMHVTIINRSIRPLYKEES